MPKPLFAHPALGALIPSGPTGPACGDLEGTYPCPTIKSGVITDDKIVSMDYSKLLNPPTIPPSLPPSGAASGDLTGFYPGPQIADNAVLEQHLRNEAVTASKIADGGVTFSKLATNSVGVLAIINGAVDRAKLAPNVWPNPIPTGADVGKVLTVGAGPALTWATPSGGGGGSGLTWRGDWAADQAYVADDVVSYLNSSWVALSTIPAGGTTYKFWDQAAPPAVQGVQAIANYTLGMEVVCTAPGATIRSVQFYKDATDTGTHTATVWRVSDQAKLAEATFTGETASGWQSVALPSPVALTVGAAYRVAVFHTTNCAFIDGQPAVTTGPLTMAAGAYYFSGGNAFPASVSGRSYLADATIAVAPPPGVDARWDLVTAGIPAGGSTGQVLSKTASTDYATAWTTPSGGGGAPSGPAGGALAGTYPDPTLAPSGVAQGIYGSATTVPVLDIRSDGRIYGVTTAVISGGGGGAPSLANTTRVLAAGLNNDLDPGTGGMLTVSAPSYATITGISGGVDGRLLYVFCTGTQGIDLEADNGLSAAPNRIQLRADQLYGATSPTLRPGEYWLLRYDGTAQRWRTLTAQPVGKIMNPQHLLDNSITNTQLGPTCIMAGNINPAPLGADVGKVLTVMPGVILGWTTPSSGGGDPTLGGDLSGVASNATVLKARGTFSTGDTLSVVRSAASGSVPGLEFYTGSSPIRLRVGSITAGNYQFYTNASLNNVQDDNTKPSLAWVYDAIAREFGFYGAPANPGSGTAVWAQMLALTATAVQAFAGNVIVGPATGSKTRVQHITSGTGGGLYVNRDQQNANAQDDTGKVSWGIQLKTDTDNVLFQRAAAGSTAQATLMVLNSVAQLTLQQAGQPIATLFDPTSSNFGIYVNNSFAPGDTSKASWSMQFTASDIVNDAWFVNRRAAGGGTGAGTQMFAINNAGNLTIFGNTATKASGTAWANPSDIRLKEDILDYNRGLEEIRQLRPVTFRYNGRAGTQKDLRAFGYIANEVQPVMPECVGTQMVDLDPGDDAKTEILTLDTSNILLALVNAVQELAARVEELEAA